MLFGRVGWWVMQLVLISFDLKTSDDVVATAGRWVGNAIGTDQPALGNQIKEVRRSKLAI